MSHMWLVAGAFTVVIVVAGGLIGGFETAMLRWHPRFTITELIKRHTHLAIIVALGMLFPAMLFGYVLGVGGC